MYERTQKGERLSWGKVKELIPILLTTLTVIGGLLPLVLEQSSLYSPLALVILGGLISSTLLTRIITPVLYKVFAPQVELAEPEQLLGAGDGGLRGLNA